MGGSLLQNGLDNTPPVSGMLPVIRLQEGCSQTIKIPGIKLVMARQPNYSLPYDNIKLTGNLHE